MKLYLKSDIDFMSFEESAAKTMPFYETNEDVNIGTPLNINGIVYVIGSISKISGIAYIYEIPNQETFKEDEPEETFEDNWTCPYCGYVNYDYFELPDSIDEMECPNCYSTVNYERVVTVDYNVTPVKRKEAQII